MERVQGRGWHWFCIQLYHLCSGPGLKRTKPLFPVAVFQVRAWKFLSSSFYLKSLLFCDKMTQALNSGWGLWRAPPPPACGKGPRANEMETRDEAWWWLTYTLQSTCFENMIKYFSQGEGFHFKLLNPLKEGNVAKHTNSSQRKHFVPEYFFPQTWW